MPRPVGYGRPATPVFPPAWSATHAAVEDTTYESTILITTADATTSWDPELRQTVTAPADTAYDGAASIRPGMRDDLDPGRPNVAEDLVRSQDFAISLPAPVAGIEEGMVVTINASPDATLEGRTLTVTAVERGDRRFSRLLGAVLNS